MAPVKGMPPPKRNVNAHVVTTLPQVAAFFKIAQPTVDRWRADGMPGKVGAWDLAEIVQWRLAKFQTSTLSEEQKAADIRLKNASARAKELENEQTEGNLVDLRLVDTWVFEMISEARGQLETLPELLGASVAPDIRAFVISEADRIVRQVTKTMCRRHEDKSQLQEETNE